MTKNKQIATTRPNIIINCSKRLLRHVQGRKYIGLRSLEYTERAANAKIIYLKKEKKMVISSDDTEANERILQKIKTFKTHMKDKNKKHKCTFCSK